jgi:lipoprotein-releasing system ATP-binding protein
MNEENLPNRLTMRGVTVSYGDRPVLRGVDLAVDRGTVALLLGSSGSGKTSLLHALGGLLRPAEGEVLWGDTVPWGRDALRGRIFGFIFQQHTLLPSMTVGENVLLPWRVRGLGPVAAGRRRAEETLAAVGLADRIGALPYELSGGERQRVSIARALILRPPFLLADEPTGSLDGESAARVRALLLSLAREFGAGLLIASHDGRFAGGVDRVYLLENGALQLREDIQ